MSDENLIEPYSSLAEVLDGLEASPYLLEQVAANIIRDQQVKLDGFVYREEHPEQPTHANPWKPIATVPLKIKVELFWLCSNGDGNIYVATCAAKISQESTYTHWRYHHPPQPETDEIDEAWGTLAVEGVDKGWAPVTTQGLIHRDQYRAAIQHMDKFRKGKEI